MRNAHRAWITLVHVALQNNYQSVFLPYATNMKSFLFPNPVCTYQYVNIIYTCVRESLRERETLLHTW